MGYKIILKKYGISEENADKVMKWAFGEWWDMIDVRLVGLSFNTFHSDLPPITPDMTIEEGLEKVAGYWLKLKKEAA
jgi:hypothetical protein